MNFNFEVQYKPGKHNGDANALSRMTPESVRAVCTAFSEDEWEYYVPGIFAECETPVGHCEGVIGEEGINWVTEQKKDAILHRARNIIVTRTHVNSSRENPAVVRLLRRRKHLKMEDNILIRECNGNHQVVLPSHLVDRILLMTHTDMGHQGRDRTLALCQERFFWTGMADDIQQFINSCNRCQRAQAPNLPEKAPLNPIVSIWKHLILCVWTTLVWKHQREDTVQSWL